MSRQKKDQAAIAARAVDLISRIEKQTTGATAQRATLEEQLAEIKRQHEFVTVKLYRKDPQTGEFGMFVELTNQSPQTLMEIGIDSLCMDQGGGGEYKVYINAPGLPPIALPGTTRVLGTPRQVPKARQDAEGLLGLTPAAGQVTQTGPNQYQIDNLLKYMGREREATAAQQAAGGDRFLMMMMQMQQQQQQAADRQMMLQRESAQQAMQMQQQMFGALFQAAKTNDAPNAELQQLMAEVRSLKESQAREAERRLHDQQIAELKQQLIDSKATLQTELGRIASTSGGDRERLLVEVMNQAAQRDAASTQQFMSLFTQQMNRPGEDERMANLLNMMVGMSTSQMQLIQQAMSTGLFSQEGGHPVLEAIKQVVGGLTEMGVAALTKRAPDGEGEYEDAPPATVLPPRPPPPQFQPPAPQATPAPPSPSVAAMGGLPMSTVSTSPPTPQTVSPPPTPPVVDAETDDETFTDDDYFTEEELQLCGEDTALAKVIADVQNGEPVQDITLRLFVHATKGNSELAQHWLTWPEQITRQVLSHYNIDEKRIAEVVKDTLAFIEHVKGGGDPAKWGATYKPKVKAARPATVVGAPDTGVRQGTAPPAVVEAYDSSKVPPGAGVPGTAPAAAPPVPSVEDDAE